MLTAGLGPFPTEALRREAELWRAGLEPPAVAPPVETPTDLQASRSWRYLRIEVEAARKLGELQNAESRALAERREELVRSRLTELTNLGLPPDADEAQAAAKRAEIWAGIEAEMAAATQASQRRLLAKQQELAVEAAAAKAKVDRELEEEAARRQQRAESREAGILRGEMAEAVQALADQQGVQKRARQLTGLGPPAGIRESAVQAQEEVRGQYEATRRLQSERLRAGQAALMRGILADTRRAVMKVAFEDNLRLHLLPAGSPVGEDLTATVRERVRAIWAGEANLKGVPAQEKIHS